MAATKKISHLKPNAVCHYVLANSAKGGLGMFSFTDDYYQQQIAHFFRLLTSPNREIAHLATQDLTCEVKKWIKKDPSDSQIEDFCNSSKAINYTTQSSNSCRNLPKRFRRAMWSVNKQISVTAKVTTDGTMALKISQICKCDPKPLEREKCKCAAANFKTIDTKRRAQVSRTIRLAVADNHLEVWSNYDSQGVSIKNTPLVRENNQFVNDGRYIDFSTYKWIHNARLNLWPTNSNKLTNHGKHNSPEDRKCRRCEHDNETLSHILNGCKSHMGFGITERHNAVQDLIVDAVKKGAYHKHAQIEVDKRCNAADRNLRPDIVIINHDKKEAVILDVTCPFRSDADYMAECRARKIGKYLPEANSYRKAGYTVHINAIVVGSLGIWDPLNTPSLNHLGIAKTRQSALIRRVVESTIHYSKTIYYTHTMGKKYDSHYKTRFEREKLNNQTTNTAEDNTNE